MKTLEKLQKKNDVPIQSVKCDAFKSYGRIVEGYDFTETLSFMAEQTVIPAEGNIYIPCVDEMQQFDIFDRIQYTLFGGMPIQIGYCNGRNSTYNGFEYHKGSEINIAATDFMLVLGHIWDMKCNTYNVADAEVFFVEKGTAIEMYQTTLHLAPCKVCEEGFKDIVILPLGTNTPLAGVKEHFDEEDEILLLKNKWVIAHPERRQLISQGAFPGLIGENKELNY